MYFLDHIGLIPLFPAIGAASMCFFGRRLQKSAVSAICVGMVVLAFAWAAVKLRHSELMPVSCSILCRLSGCCS